MEGNDISGVNVPRTSRSQSRALTRSWRTDRCAASTHRSRCRLMGRGVSALEDARPLDDPIRVETQPGVEMSLPTTMSGMYFPVPSTRMPIGNGTGAGAGA